MKKHPNILKRIAKISLFVLIILMLVISLTVFVFLKTEFGQKKAGSIASTILTKKLKTQVSIDKISIGLLNSAKLYRVQVFDHHDSLCIYAGLAKIYFHEPFQANNTFVLDRVYFDGLRLNFIKYSEKEKVNIQYIIDNTKKESDPDNPKPTGTSIIHHIIVINSSFRYSAAYLGKSKSKIDFNDLRLSDLNFYVKDFYAKGKYTRGKILSMKAAERSGFRIEKMRSLFSIDSQLFHFTKLNLRTNESRIKGYIHMNFNDWQDFSNFEEEVNISAKFRESILFFKDLEYFGAYFASETDSIGIEGIFNGRINKINGKELQLVFGDGSIFRGSADFRGLPNIRETFIRIDAQNAKLNFADLGKLLPSVRFPEYFFNLGAFTFNGNYTGFINDFVAYGKLKTPLGRIITDLNFKTSGKDGIPNYSGHLELQEFNLGKFLNQEKYTGYATLQVNIQGSGLSLADVKADINAEASSAEFYQYPYQDIKLKGYIEKSLFKGWLVVNDKNINLIFNGNINLKKEEPEYKFIATLNNTNLHKLNLSDNQLGLNCLMDIDLKGRNIDDMTGSVIIKNIHFQLDKAVYDFDSLVLSSMEIMGNKSIRIMSDLLNATIEGKYQISKLPVIFRNAASEFLDTSFISSHERDTSDQFLDFDIHLYNTSFLNKILGFRVILENNTILKGSLRNKDKYIDISCIIPGFTMDNIFAEKVHILAKSQDSLLHLILQLNKVNIKDSIVADVCYIDAITSKDSINFDLSLDNKNYSSRIMMNANLFLNKKGGILNIQKANLISYEKNWHLRAQSIYFDYSPHIQIPYMELSNTEEKIILFGGISKEDETESLRCVLDNLSIGSLKKYIRKGLGPYTGKINGNIMVFSVLKNPVFDAGLFFNNLIYNEKDTLGFLQLSSISNANTGNIGINALLVSPANQEVLKIDGFMNYSGKGLLDLDFIINNPPAQYFESFTEEFISSLKGHVKGKARLYGNFEEPTLEGTLNFENFAFTLNYLNTNYNFSHEIKIDKNKIYIDKLQLYDRFGQQAFVNGFISHQYFSDFKVNINILASNLEALNTELKEGELYYGNAYASGKIGIKGPLNNLVMDMMVRSEPNTKIHLPVYLDNYYGTYNFIRFTDRKQQDSYKQKINVEGISINLDMELNENAEIKILFDPEAGDELVGRGNGNLKIELDNTGNMNMFGSYNISEGKYSFTALNVIKREFTVSPGSQLQWRGDPMDAIIDVKALYNLKASIYELGTDKLNEDNSSIKQKVPVEVIIALKNNLFSPDIKLDFNIETTSNVSSGADITNVERQVRMIKNDEAEMNKQVISLLIFGRFQPVSTGISARSDLEVGLNSNVSSIISNQLSSWISNVSSSSGSKYLENLEIGINYEAETKEYQRELELAMSTSLFNDRINISGSYDIENISNNFELDYKIGKRHNYRLKLFNRSDNNPIYNDKFSRQGIGIFLVQEFDKWKELFRKRKVSER
jgi:hypothetical protein